MFSAEHTYVNYFLLCGLLFCIGCVTSGQNGQATPKKTPNSQPRSALQIDQQTAPPSDIQSVQLYPKNALGKAPIIKLNGSQKLTLSFDYLDTQSRQFRIEVSHRTQKWEESTITPSTYLEGFSYDFIQQAHPSTANSPSYRQVNYDFPNNKLKPAVSGNYLLKVFDSNHNLQFSMPFFITEDRGRIQSKTDRLFAKRNDGRPLDQLSATYRYPSFVEYPQFDLSMSFAANQFWGKMREADFLDTITKNKLNARLKIDNSYVANYEFKTLNLRSFRADGKQIIEYRPGETPPTVILHRDVERFGTSGSSYPLSNVGKPSNNLNSKYGNIQFSLVPDSDLNQESNIYVVGDFNNWLISEHNKLHYNAERKLWEGNALIKQGQYAYKYLQVSGNTVDEIALDQHFVSSAQEYFTFVYFEDPDQHYDRLLKVDRIIKR